MIRFVLQLVQAETYLDQLRAVQERQIKIYRDAVHGGNPSMLQTRAPQNTSRIVGNAWFRSPVVISDRAKPRD